MYHLCIIKLNGPFVSLSLVWCWWLPENTREPGPGADVESGGLTSQHQGQPKHSQHCPMILSM